MRDGTKLYTVIVVPKGAENAPIVLTRTPYNAKGRANRMDSPSMLSTLPLSDEIFVKDGYIRVYQDIRGKYGSEGDYIVNRPPVGPLNPTKVRSEERRVGKACVRTCRSRLVPLH